MQDQGGSPHMLVELVVDCSSVGDEKRDLMAMVVEIRNMARPKLFSSVHSYQGGLHMGREARQGVVVGSFVDAKDEWMEVHMLVR